MDDVVKFMVENWYLLIAGLALAVAACFMLYRFFQLPTKKQIARIKQWLLYAVAEAEKELGSGTGQLKLRQVYDLFVQRFPAVAAVISFDTFSGWVDEALEQMREMLAKNEQVAAYVENCFLVQEIREGVAIDG